MSVHERFKFKSSGELLAKSKLLGPGLPFSEDLSPLFDPVIIGGKTVLNRIVVQPMEGYDSEPDGSPSYLTTRRYLRYAEGGSGMIWVEATAVAHEGRSNPGQLWINDQNRDKFRSLVDEMRSRASVKGFDPYLVIQLTHSGRYSKPEGKPRPLVPALNPVLDKGTPIILTDDDLKKIMDQFIIAVKNAEYAGFDAVDIKSCHGYLVHELLSCRQRKDSIYGGEKSADRFRFFLETIDQAKKAVPHINLTTRLCIYDGYKGGFGIGADEMTPDFTEPLMLIGELKERGLDMINITMGSPYYNPYIVRPYDNPLPGAPPPSEHPLEGVMRMISGTALVSRQYPDLIIAGSAYSYLREYAPNVGAAIIKNGDASLIGFGRNSFAYPDMPRDLMEKGFADRNKVCITCSGCTRLIRSLRPGGCVIRDREIYGKELKKLISDEKHKSQN